MTSAEFRRIFAQLFGTLGADIQSVLARSFGDRAPFIYFGNEEVNKWEDACGSRRRTVKRAATTGPMFAFRIEEIKATQLSLCGIIHHELAHSYHFAKGDFELQKLADDIYRKNVKSPPNN